MSELLSQVNKSIYLYIYIYRPSFTIYDKEQHTHSSQIVNNVYIYVSGMIPLYIHYPDIANMLLLHWLYPNAFQSAYYRECIILQLGNLPNTAVKHSHTL